MRANTGGHAVVLPCPQCARTWSTEQTLAGHLMDEHRMDASPAVARAMQVAHEVMDKRHPKVGGPTNGGDAHEPPQAPAEAKERPMTNEYYTCSKCGTKGHNARSPGCPARSAPVAAPAAPPRCGRCHRPKDDHTAGCALGAGKKRQPVTRHEPKAAASANGFAGALTELRAEREELNAAIAALERLEARGR